MPSVNANPSPYLPPSYLNGQDDPTVSTTTANTVAAAIENDADALPPAARASFLTMVDQAPDLAPGADGAPPADLTRTLARLQSAASSFANSSASGDDAFALDEALIENAYQWQTQALDNRLNALQLQMDAYQEQADSEASAATDLSSGAGATLALSLIGAGFSIGSGLVGFVGAANELSELSDLDEEFDASDAPSMLEDEEEYEDAPPIGAEDNNDFLIDWNGDALDGSNDPVVRNAQTGEQPALVVRPNVESGASGAREDSMDAPDADSDDAYVSRIDDPDGDDVAAPNLQVDDAIDNPEDDAGSESDEGGKAESGGGSVAASPTAGARDYFEASDAAASGNETSDNLNDSLADASAGEGSVGASRPPCVDASDNAASEDDGLAAPWSPSVDNAAGAPDNAASEDGAAAPLSSGVGSAAGEPDNAAAEDDDDSLAAPSEESLPAAPSLDLSQSVVRVSTQLKSAGSGSEDDLAPEDDFYDELSSGDGAGAGPGAADPQGAASNGEDEDSAGGEPSAGSGEPSSASDKSLTDDSRLQLRLARSTATGKRFQGASQVLSGAGQLFEAGASFANSTGQSNSQQDQADASVYGALATEFQQQASAAENVEDTVQTFLTAMIEEAQSLLEAKAASLEAITRA